MKSTEDAAALAAIAAAPELKHVRRNRALARCDAGQGACIDRGRALQRLSRRDQTSGAWAAIMYFDRLPHDKPDRALDLALEVLRSESDKPTVMQLNDKFMLVADVCERRKRDRPDRGGGRGITPGCAGCSAALISVPTNRSRIASRRLGDSERWRKDAIARRTPKHPLDCEAMSVPELARAWVEQYSKSDRDRDGNFFAMMDYESELREQDPDKAIDLIVAILEIETNPALLSLLAAGPLEDVISMETIDRIEREAQANERFRDLLGRRLVLPRLRRVEGPARRAGR